MVSFKSFCTHITTYIKKEQNCKLQKYINDNRDHVKTYNESEYRIPFYNCFLYKCITRVNLQGLFILFSSGFTLDTDNSQYCIIGLAFKSGDFDICFFLMSLGFTTNGSIMGIVNIMESDKIITVDDIDIFSRIYSMSTIMEALSYYTMGYKFVHSRAMYILDAIPSNNVYSVKNVYLKPENQSFVTTLLENSYIDPSEMWQNTIQFSLSTTFEWTAYVYHKEDSIMESLCCKTLELAIYYGADTSGCLIHDRHIQVCDLNRYVLDNPSRIRKYYRRDKRKYPFRYCVESIGRVKRIYKRIMELYIYTQRCRYTIKKIRGFRLEDGPCSFDLEFITLPSEIFGHIVSFIV